MKISIMIFCAKMLINAKLFREELIFGNTLRKRYGVQPIGRL